GGLKGTANGFSYNLRLAYRSVSNMAFYYSDYFDAKRFYVAYDPSVNAFNGLLELGYNHKDDLRLLASVDFNSYSLSTNTKAWYEPMVKFDLKGSYIIEKKIIVGADIYAFSNYY